jgi:hypothetical protein
VAEPVTDADVAGKWVGYYDCAQGKTGLSLTMEAQPGGVVSGTFEFFPVPENPRVPTGSYKVKGSVSGRKVALAGAEWIQQPPGYATVGLAGDVSSDGDTYAGKIQNSSCGAFSLHKTREK